MFNNKAYNILTLSILLLLLSACNSSNNTTEVIVEEEPGDSTTENEQEDQTQTEDEQPQEEPEVEEEEEIVLPTDELQKGDQGDHVQTLQEALAIVGYEISISGTYNLETVWAITDLQMQSEDVFVTGIYDDATKLVLENYLKEEVTISPGEGLPLTDDKYLDDETVVIGNPYEVLALINKQHALPVDYKPSDMVVPDVRFPFVEDLPKKQMRKVAAEALTKMFADADLESLDLFAQSGYRSYETQDYLFASYVSNHGEEQANTFSARPGESEHQSGLTMDVTSPHVNYSLVTDFGETEEGIWLHEHAAEYGFIIRYPKGKEDITGYQYEPWHLRYVGVKAATTIMERGITLEEYLEEILSE
ncbi:D-alanyl-D-alanine carboxypeptidase family protein [Ornithinibacillus californiensis]|uniref:D-alanyl-D-alanine carboxypeptidase family protein n=1 Tax=Ornithinibacillus californiensis TaxID=161536 RepID=UPI00064D8EC0|nr:D-alanyl-D-alanine carboxypeptidase family protein [Ornithinibacillus californiensis]